MQGERRIITMLFCDVKGSTAAAEQLDPEEWTEIINGAFEHMIRPIYKYEGTVPRLMGDAILAFFGAPIAHEDDPQRAVLAGLEIQANIEPYAQEVRQRFGVNFALRVGINTGLVVVGTVGSDLRMEYTAIGDAINLAARMEQTAAPGSVQISGETYKLVAPFFEYQFLGGIEVKGKAQPVQAYRVLSVKETPGQLRGLEGLSSPLVGREDELSALVEGLATLQRGTGAAITVVGEAGLGKSTLVAASRPNSHVEPVTWLEAHALSYAQSVSYFSWRQILRNYIAAYDSDSPGVVRDKLQKAVDRYGFLEDNLAFLEAMLGVESPASAQKVKGYQGEQLFQQITNATRDFLINAAREKPLAIIFDDLHWMDEASLALLANLVGLVEEHPLLFICLMRPEHNTPAWNFNQRLQRELPACSRQIELFPFSNETTNSLLLNLLGKRDLPKSLYDQIIAKAEGNPFFVEEIIRSLIETGQILRENGNWRAAGDQTKISLPKTLTGVLSARIDRLPEDAKKTLHVASVIGRSFDLHTLSMLTAVDHELESYIEMLQQAGLIQPIGADNQAEFIFRHALLHDAAYNSILLKRRRELHNRVGEYLEQAFPDRLNEYAPLLAHHFYTARDPRSLKYDSLAGENALRLYANSEAATHLSRALEVALRMEVSHEQVESLFKQLGQALELSGRYEDALETYSQMETYAQERELPSMQVTALTAKATIYSIFTRVHSPEMSEQMLVKALAISEEIGDRGIQARLHWNLMLNYLFSKRLDQALEHGQLALGSARESGDREQLAFVLNDLCRLFTTRGEFKKAHVAIQEARELWRGMNNQVMLADSFGSQAEAHFNAGEFKLAVKCCEQALQITEKIDNQWGQSYDQMLMSFIYLETGRLGAGIQLAEKSIRLADAAGLMAGSLWFRSELGLVYAYCGNFEKAFEVVAQALKIAEAKQPAWRAFPQAGKIRVHLMQGDLHAAMKAATNDLFETIAIPYARYTIFEHLANVELAIAKGDLELGLRLAEELLIEAAPLTRVDIPDVLRWKGVALFGLNRFGEARRVLNEACALAKKLGANSQLWLIFSSLANVNERLGNHEQARENQKEARKIVAQIAESLKEVGLRDSFLERPRVRVLMRDERME